MSYHAASLSWQAFLGAVLLLLALPAAAQRFGETGPVPAGAKVTLELDKTEFFLGENVLVHFKLENVGNKPFSYNYGGDYRGSARSLRFKVAATGPDGLPVTDPDPSAFSLGGLSSSPGLKPGAHVYWSLSLIRYCRLDKPGRYDLRVTHDFGWKGTLQGPLPTGEVRFTLLMPTPAQAAQVIAEMDAMIPLRFQSWGEKSKPVPDFSALRYPVYLPLLQERARQADPKAFETALTGISSIPTPEATQALLALTDNSDPSRALAAGYALNTRLPDPVLQGRLIHRSPFQDPSAAPRKYLTQTGWREKFAPAVRTRARKFLAAADPAAVVCGAFMLECVGTQQELPALLTALNVAIEKAPPFPAFEGYYPRSYGACTELERATLVQVQQGAVPPAVLNTLAEQDLFLQALAAKPQFRPADWENKCLAVTDGPNEYLKGRALATLAGLASLPPALIGQITARLPRLLLDKNEDVQVGACGLAAKIKSPALHAPVLETLASVHDFPLPSMATQAAYFQGLRWEALKFWADSLDDPARKQDALGFLTELVGRSSGSNSNFDAATGADLKARWDRFLLAHRAEIEAGKKYSRTDPEVQALFPPTIFIFGSGSF